MDDSTMGTSISIAAGMMLGCSVVLAIESALASSCWALAIGICLGASMIKGIQWFFTGQEDLTFGDLKGRNAAAGLVIFFSMLLHSLGEGLSIGVSETAADVTDKHVGLNIVVLFSIAIHNIPEGMAICMAYRSKGMSLADAAWYAFLSNLPQPLSALASFGFMRQFAATELAVPLGLGAASGAMLYVVWNELIPEALEKVSLMRGVPVMLTAGVVVLFLDAYSHFVSFDNALKHMPAPSSGVEL
jgi:zinc transporter ZupT